MQSWTMKQAISTREPGSDGNAWRYSWRGFCLPGSRIGQRGAFDRVACEQASTRGSIAAVEPTCPHVGQTTCVSMRSWLPPRHAVDKVWTALNQQLGQLGDVGGDAPGLVGRLTPRATMSGLGV